jgi:hypothetical protein
MDATPICVDPCNAKQNMPIEWILGKQISQVAMSRLPLHLEVMLSHAVPDPVPPHVHGLGLALGAGGIGHRICAGVVRDEQGGFLGVPEVVKCVALALAIMAVGKEAAIFGFSRGGLDTTPSLGWGLW